MNENDSNETKNNLEQLLKEKQAELKELEKLGKNSNYIKQLSDIALIQLQLKQFSESEKNYLICLKHFEKLKDRLGQADVYGIMGTLFFEKVSTPITAKAKPSHKCHYNQTSCTRCIAYN